MLNMVKVMPALAVGCSVVLKPHPWNPLDAFEIARAAAEADMPPGVLNVITGHADVERAVAWLLRANTSYRSWNLPRMPGITAEIIRGFFEKVEKIAEKNGSPLVI